MTTHGKPTPSTHDLRPLKSTRQAMGADMKSARQLPPLTNGLFNNLFHLVADRTGPAEPDFQALSLVPPSPNR